ncbi:hypothetical protein PR048_010636 [Dryococelus australis]|uniref:Uncharacterized protein n=1 Tax=Dryococelus australis TaxID=614101 RepID=A0ABQ9I391_9NEOP|nr:hypothetical protein PR048_010636 [Dryococelus australis]
MDTQGAKNANSVASFLYDCLQKLLLKFGNVKTVVLLSDAAGGQNRNATMVKFCARFSYDFGVEIFHLFPVCRHTFTQCDQNFGLVRSKIKKKGKTGTAKPWL